jgi:hypothetical protein
MGTDVKLNRVRLAFPTLWEPKEFKPGDGKPRYSAVFLIEPGSENDKAIWAAIRAEAKNVYGKSAEANIEAWKFNSNKFAYIDGKTKPDIDGYPGNFALSTHSKVQPTLIGPDRQPLIKSSGLPYGGCYVNAIVNIWAQGHEGGNPGMRATVTGVQFSADGPAFGGVRPASADAFDVVDMADAMSF